MVVMIFLGMLKMKKKRRVEGFNNSDKFFILQNTEINDIYTINNINNCTRIGYILESDKEFFKLIYKMHNDIEMEFTFVRLEDEKDITSVDILLYVGDTIDLERNAYRYIDYFERNKYKWNPYLNDYKFVIHNDIEMSILVMRKKIQGEYQKEIRLNPKESLSKEYNFVIEFDINGKYREVNLNESDIVLYQDKILGLEVEVGNTILLKNQKHIFMNGEYVVYSVNKYIHMVNKNRNLLPKHFVCIDNDLNEHHQYINKYSCEYNRDMVGEKKKIGMTWDARCRRNIECPFFDKDNDYKGYCGLNGYCDMPYNVKQISFTKYKK
jgi:hypothetical protein